MSPVIYQLLKYPKKINSGDLVEMDQETMEEFSEALNLVEVSRD
jgi:hypothetical protein